VLLKTWRVFTIVLVTLLVAMPWSHLLQLAPRMHYDADLYLATQRTLFQYYGSVGAVVEGGAIVAVGFLVLLVRNRRPALWLTVAAALCLVAATLIWFRWTNPADLALVSAAAAPPPDWMRLRVVWESTQAVRAALDVTALALLALSVVWETPDGDGALARSGRP
jgi:hypothetical protein